MRYLIGTMLVFCALSAPALAQTGGYTIPPDNPFAATAGARGEIYVYGLRNPFRWSFDRLTGDAWVGDVGGIEEEITHLRRADIAGANLGWNCYSGDRFQTGCQPPDHVPPSYTWPSGPDVSIGGYVIRAPDLPSFAGRYVFSKLVSGIHLLSAATTAEAESAGLNVFAVVSFGEDGVGHLYAISQATNAIYRIGESGGALTLSSIGTFNRPVAVAASAGDDERLFIVEQPGKIKLRLNGRVTEFLDLTGLTGEAHEEEGLLAVGDRARLRHQRPRVRLLRRQQRRPPARRVHARGHGTGPLQHRHAQAAADDPPPPGRQPQRRAAAVRPGRLSLPVHRRRRRAPGCGPSGRRPEPRVAARQDPAHRRTAWRPGRATRSRPHCERARSTGSARGASAAWSPTCAATSAARWRWADGCASASASSRCAR